MMNNVVLLNTSYRKSPNSKYSTFGPPMGLLSIGAALKASGYSVELIDPQLDRDYMNRLRLAVEQRPLLVGMSTYLGENVENAVELSRYIKSIDSDVPIVLGGPLASSIPEVFLRQMPSDYIVMGSGEATIVSLAEAIRTGADTTSVPHISFQRDGKVTVGDLYSFDGNLDDLPSPDLSLWAEGVKAVEFVPLITSRGCHRGCAFCYNTFTGRRRYYLKSTERVIGEMDDWSNRYGISRFEFYDDNFLLDSTRALTILSEMQRRGWTAGRIFGHLNEFDRITPEQLAPCVTSIVMCVESASPRIQKLLNKPLSLDKVLALVARISATRASFLTAFMFGLPTETDEDIRASVQFAERIRRLRAANRSMCYIYVPQPKDAIIQNLGPEYPVEFSLETVANVEVVPVPPDNKLDLRLRPWMTDDDRQFYLDFVQVWQYHFAGLCEPSFDVESIYRKNERVRRMFQGIAPPQAQDVGISRVGVFKACWRRARRYWSKAFGAPSPSARS